jgi:hypothetical protein
MTMRYLVLASVAALAMGMGLAANAEVVRDHRGQPQQYAPPGSCYRGCNGQPLISWQEYCKLHPDRCSDHRR